MAYNISGKRFGKLVAIKKVGYDKDKNILWECVCDCGAIKNIPAGRLVHGQRACSSSCSLIKDLTNRKFGKLKVIRMVGKTKAHSALWECICDCGKIKNISSLKLTRTYHAVKSCGCARRKDYNHLIGKRFGKLIVIDFPRIKNIRRSTARCICDCGKETIVRVSQLLVGVVESCGCLSRRRGTNSPLWRKDLSQKERLLQKARGYAEHQKKAQCFSVGMNFGIEY